MPAGKDKPVIVPYREHVPPDTVACIFWLKNRRREEWRDKHEVDHSGSLQFKDLSLEEIRQRIAVEEFSAALKKGKGEANSRVERSLYHRPVGYSYDAVKIFMPAGKDRPVIVPYREHVPPDTVACIFWPKDRQREEWRDKQEVDHSGSLQIKDLSLEEIRQRIADELEKLGPILDLEAIRDPQGIENRHRDSKARTQSR